MLKTRQLGRTCKAAIVGVSLSIALSGCAPATEQIRCSGDWWGTSSQCYLAGTSNRQAPRNLLVEAAEAGSVDRVVMHLGEGMSVNTTDEYGNTPLIGAARRGHVEVARLLLSLKAKVDKKNDDGSVALMEAIRYDQRDMAELLLENGANPNMRDKKRNTPLIMTAYRHAAALNDYKNGKDTGGSYVSMFYHLELAKWLIALGVDKNAENKDGVTAMRIATDNYDTEMANILRR